MRASRHSTASHSSRRDMLAVISSRYQYGPFLFFVVEVMSNYLTTDGLKKIISTSGGPPEAVAFAISATWLIRHCSRSFICIIRFAYYWSFLSMCFIPSPEAPSFSPSASRFLDKLNDATTRPTPRRYLAIACWCAINCSWIRLFFKTPPSHFLNNCQK